MQKFQEYDRLIWDTRPGLHKKIGAAVSLLRKAKEEHDSISISYSGGKDSTAALMLCLEAGIKPEVVWFNSGYEYPETEPYIKAVVKRYQLPLREILPGFDALEAKKQVGFFDLEAINKENKRILHNWHVSNREYDCVITGMRAEESIARRRTIGKNGNYFYNKTYKAYALYPCAFLSAEEIFAVLAGYEQPYHPLYEKAKTLEERYWLRVNWYILSIAEKGYYVFLRQHYPEQYAQLCKNLPEIRCYV